MTMRMIISGLTLVIFLGTPGGAAAAVSTVDPDVFTYLPGNWGNSSEHTCTTNPHAISVSEDRSRVTFTYKTPPVASGEYRTLPVERRSPEESSGTTIEFQVLEYGDTWVGLRRVGETETDRLAKPRAWKLTLSKDRMSYRWWLYRSVAGKKSLLRGVRCEPDEYEKNQAIDFFAIEHADPVLAEFLGRWESDSFAMGKLVRHVAEGTAVLQGRFIRIEIEEHAAPPRYEAVIYVGRSTETDDYVAYWIDANGAGKAPVVGSGSYDDGKLMIRIPGDQDTGPREIRFRTRGFARNRMFELAFFYTDPESGVSEEVSTYQFKVRE